MPDVVMPRLSDSMEEGTILKWLKSDGDEVARGDELVEIETDKANMTYEADQDGVLAIVAKEGDTLPVGEVIATIGEGGSGDGGAPAKTEADSDPDDDAADDDASASEDKAASEDEADASKDDGAADQPAADEEPKKRERAPAPVATRDGDGDGAGNGRVKASPVARRMARELGLDLQALEGSGPGGRIVKADIEAASREGGARAATAERTAAPEAPAPAREPDRDGDGDGADKVPPAPASTGDQGKAKGDVERRELSKLQQVVARRMAESKATAPDFALNADVDMEQAVDLRRELKELAGEGGVVPSFNDMVVKAAALALREFPRANGAYRDGAFELYSRVNVGIAVAAQDSLVVPTIFDADSKSLGEIARDARALAQRVRGGAITPPELSGGTFTVSNLGMYGIRSFTAVINPPQAAILSVGELAPRAVVHDGELTARHVMSITLSCDHRILYGAEAAEFLGRIRALLEQPLALAL